MASEELQPIQGMADLAPPEINLWQRIERSSRLIFERYGFGEIRTPILEKASVFIRSLGDTTDVVQKEMYLFEDRGGRKVAVRPEGTASVIRYVALKGQDAQAARLYYIGPMFRCERPQAGRKRQFHQIGAESIGGDCAAADAEMIAMQVHLLREIGLRDFKINVNTRGLPEDRVAVTTGLRQALEPHIPQLCDDCRRRIDTNILRVLDCKNDGCKAIARTLPTVTSFMSESSRNYLDEVLRLLKLLEIDVNVNPMLIRGLDYYVHTVWEITHPALGSQDALAGGGRYRITISDRTVEGVGFAMGVERLIMAVQQDDPSAAKGDAKNMVWLVSFGQAAFEENLKLMQALRFRGVRCGMDLSGRGMKAQMRAADRSGATAAVIRGDTELNDGTFQLKDMVDGVQVTVAMPELLERLTSKLTIS